MNDYDEIVRMDDSFDALMVEVVASDTTAVVVLVVSVMDHVVLLLLFLLVGVVVVVQLLHGVGVRRNFDVTLGNTEVHNYRLDPHSVTDVNVPSIIMGIVRHETRMKSEVVVPFTRHTQSNVT